MGYGTGAISTAQVTVAKKAPDMIDTAESHCYNDGMMKKTLPKDVYERFQDALKTGEPTSDADQKAIADAMLKWARGLGATSFSHWFFLTFIEFYFNSKLERILLSLTFC